MDKEFKIENWSVCQIQDDYNNPGSTVIRIDGNVYGNPRFEDGTIVITSDVKEVDGTLIVTKTGSRYRLGKISDSYLEFLIDNSVKYDKDNPIKTVRCGQSGN